MNERALINETKLHSPLNYSSASSNTVNSIVITALILINPDIVIENSKVYFGLTKEISVGKFPFGRAAFEYTFLFGNIHKNNFRISYFFDIPVFASGGNSVLMLSPGFGYYTDTEKSGLCPQLAFGIMSNSSFGKEIKIHPYIKFRKTFIKGKENPDFMDISLGCGLALYY